MIDEQEIPGASNSANDAPSLETARASKRQKLESRRARENRENNAPKAPPHASYFTIYKDQPTPPPSQVNTYSSQTSQQKGLSSTSQQKKRVRATSPGPQIDPVLEEPWLQAFNAAKGKPSKFQVLIEALGHEDFPDYLHIPERQAKAKLPEGFKLDPLDPLTLWSHFISPEVLQTIAEHTNEYESLQFGGRTRTKYERSWHNITGADVGAFIGAAMLMGVHPQARLSDYWNTSEDKPIFPIQRYISRQKFQQICRYLKVNSPHENVTKDRFFDKLEPLMSSFRTKCQETVQLPNTVSIDENLIAARTRTIHLMQIGNKAAGKGFKIYTLCAGYYLYDWMYTSKAAKVPQAKYFTPQNPGYGSFTDSERMVLTLVEGMVQRHPELRFSVVFDNFFSTTRLFDELRSWGVGAYGTAKKGSGIPIPHIMIDTVASKERDYGEVVNTVVSGGRINCITFIDQGVVWMMSTVHDTANEPTCWRPITKRKAASTHLSRQSTTGDTELPFPLISDDYNHYMNGSDLCQQMWDEYDVSEHAHWRNWWPLFWQIINACIGNCLYVFRLEGFDDSEITHQQLQERVSLQLLRNPAAVMREVEWTTLASTKRKTDIRRPTEEHS
jgi:hypothetical protein